VQHAAPRLLALVDDLGTQILDRVRDNRARLAAALVGTAGQLLAADGGWSAIVRVPAVRSEEEWVLQLLDDGVLVHPGFFFDLSNDLASGAHLVLSLLPAPDRFAAGVERLRRLVI
jgi:DNA-binding transcriptional MocR family regulator